jgi:carbamoyltransferase
VSGKVVGWFEGRAEFGPRALGHRSILADPKNPAMKNIVNSKIKFREEFRPFAPVILSEHAKAYYKDADSLMSPFMLATFQATSRAKKIAPATVHVDGTSRIQTVGKHYRGRYRRVLEVFYAKTHQPILLNTSFNLKGEPIVNSPADAYATFIRSGIDVLILEKYVIVK